MEENKEVVSNEKEIKEKKKKPLIIRIFDIIVWLAIFVWMCVCVTDYFNVANEKEPRFCIETEVLQYDDGTIDVCKGAGYVIYRSNRKSATGYQFGPFWSDNRFAK